MDDGQTGSAADPDLARLVDGARRRYAGTLAHALSPAEVLALVRGAALALGEDLTPAKLRAVLGLAGVRESTWRRVARDAGRRTLRVNGTEVGTWW